MAIVSGQILDGRYRIVGSIARGGMGTVYEAEDLRLRRRVAVKVLLEALANDSSCRERFRREAEAAARTTHPNLVALYDLSLEGTPAYLVMELLEGATLEATLARDGVLPWRVAARIGVELTAALACLHAAGIVHRDLKPSNVLIETSGRAKLIDLGVAQLRTGVSYERLTHSGAIVGTPGYLAPEQLGGGAITERTDLWALGVLLYYLLSGQRPFAAADLSRLLWIIAHEAPTPLDAVAPSTPEALQALVMSLLSKDPAQRPVSAASTQQALSRLIGASEPDLSTLGAGGQARWDLSVGAGDLRTPLAASWREPMPSPQERRGLPEVSPSDPTHPPRRTRSLMILTAALGFVGVLATLALGLGLTLLFSTRRTADPVPPAVAAPIPMTSAPAGLPAPTRLEITHRGTDALETTRLLAPTLDPILRECVDLGSHSLGQAVTYSIYLNVDGSPSRLERPLASQPRRRPSASSVRSWPRAGRLASPRRTRRWSSSCQRSDAPRAQNLSSGSRTRLLGGERAARSQRLSSATDPDARRTP